MKNKSRMILESIRITNREHREDASFQFHIAGLVGLAVLSAVVFAHIRFVVSANVESGFFVILLGLVCFTGLSGWVLFSARSWR